MTQTRISNATLRHVKRCGDDFREKSRKHTAPLRTPAGLTALGSSSGPGSGRCSRGECLRRDSKTIPRQELRLTTKPRKSPACAGLWPQRRRLPRGTETPGRAQGAAAPGPPCHGLHGRLARTRGSTPPVLHSRRLARSAKHSRVVTHDWSTERKRCQATQHSVTGATRSRPRGWQGPAAKHAGRANHREEAFQSREQRARAPGGRARQRSAHRLPGTETPC